MEMQGIDLWTRVGEKRGEGEISGESSVDAYILTYVNSQWGFAV